MRQPARKAGAPACFGKIADALIVNHMNGKSLEQGLHNFKALVERQ
jgi:hypothetical protein